MNSEAIDELIQSVLEGDASPSDVSRLERLVATDADVRERHARLKQAFEVLAEGAALEDPPADLKASILAEIRQQQAAARSRTAPRPVSRPAFSWLRLALPLAACAAAAVVVLWNGRASAPRPAAEGTTGAIAAAPRNAIALGEGDRAVSIAWHELSGGRFALDVGAGAGPVTLTIVAREARLDRPTEAIALEPGAKETLFGEVLGDAPAIRVTLAGAADGPVTRDVDLTGLRH